MGGGSPSRSFSGEAGDIKSGIGLNEKEFLKFTGMYPALAGPNKLGVPYLSDIIGAHGALSRGELRDETQRSRVIGQQQYGFGESAQLGNLANEVINRDSAKWRKFLEAINASLGIAQASQKVYSGIADPMIAYLSNLNAGNLQAATSSSIANQQFMGGLIDSVIGSIGSIAGAAAMSDERVKTKLRDTGVTTHEGIPLKTWEYKTRPGVRFLGPTAQDVEKKLPDRVATDPVSGMKFVIGFPMIEISPMKRREAA